MEQSGRMRVKKKKETFYRISGIMLCVKKWEVYAMKKWIVLVLVFVLTMCAAQAEGMDNMLRERKLIVNGVEETLTESKYISEKGFVLWVDADHFWPMNMNGGGNDEFVDTASALGDEERTVYIIMVDSEVPNSEAETFIGEAVAMYPPRTT